ncbi:MAG: SusD/RagB family nutrient-binding outer membrane lipoprotein [Bacteroidales bacterium]|nr:SusD/RagB family nutrient-binding outer membrane lipoprotein [Bacteroidales bacterium]
MKKILYSAIAGLFALSSCNLDINDNPNYPSSENITPALQFPAAINSIADAVGSQMMIYGGFFAQYFEQMPEANQYNDIAELNIDESKDLFRRTYRSIYAGALQDLKEIDEKTTNPANRFAAAVLRAQAFQLLVDNTSETPYKEALQGNGNTTPRYDDGKTVYEGVLAELDAAQAAVADNKIDMTDPLLNKDVDQWKGYANALRLRMYMRLIDGGVDAAGYSAKAKALVEAGEFFSGDVKWDVYSPVEGQFNPFYGTKFALNANNFCAAYPIAAYMSETADPRIAYSMAPRASDKAYVGQFPGAKQGNIYNPASHKNNSVSAINVDDFKDAPIYLFTQSELQFLIAEVQYRFCNAPAAAKAAYEAAVKADFNSRGVEGASEFLAAAGSWDAAADKLELVYMQKWVALLMRNHMEAWSEIRRTDVPKLSAYTAAQINASPDLYTPGELIAPDVNYYGKGNIAMRVPYSSDSRKYNSNTPAAKMVSDKVFWDVK